MKVYVNGAYYDKAEASVSVFDHGLLYGDGVFEGLRIYNGSVFKLREHINRLYMSARALCLDVPLSQSEMEAAVQDAVKVNEKTDGYIRLIVTRGEGLLGIDPYTCKKATVIIIVGDIQLYPADYYEKGITVVTASSRRMPSDCLDPRIKSLNYLNNIMAKIEARQAGCMEAVMLNKEGLVVECTADNLFIVTNGEVLTPLPHHGALDGITMRAVLELAGRLGIPARQQELTRYDLYTADECFLTGTGAEVMPVVGIDGRSIGRGEPGNITKTLMRGFVDIRSKGQV